MLRGFALVLAMLATGPTAAPAAGLPYPSTALYAIYRNGQQVGWHRLRFDQQGDLRTVYIDCEVAIKALGMVVYRFSHRGRETWHGERLQSLQASTDDDGRRFTVSAEQQGGSLAVERSSPGSQATTVALMDPGQAPAKATRELMPAGTLPTSQWNIRQVGQSALLDTQHGKLIHVHVAPRGRELVRTGTRNVPADRYSYSGGLRMDQWFDENGRWVKGTFVAFDRSTIEYILQE